MAFDLLTNLDVHNNQLLNVLLQLLASDPGSPSEGRAYYNTTDKCIHFYNGTSWLILGRLDQMIAPTASVAFNAQKITGLADPTLAQDGATKAYVDNVAAGMKWKNAVRAATTVAGTLASSFENGDAIDSVTLATGDRILVKNQAAPAENGIYTVNASGAPTRATDADTATEILQAAMFVMEGTTNADTAWVLSTNAPITLNTTSLSFAQFTGGSGVSGGAGLVLTGSVMDVVAGTTPGTGGPGGGIVVNADDIVIDKAVVVRKFAQDIGDGVTTSIVVTHNLGTVDVNVAVHDKTTPFAEQHAEVRHTSTNTVTLVFAVAPTTNQYRCTIHA